MHIIWTQPHDVSTSPVLNLADLTMFKGELPFSAKIPFVSLTSMENSLHEYI